MRLTHWLVTAVGGGLVTTVGGGLVLVVRGWQSDGAGVKEGVVNADWAAGARTALLTRRRTGAAGWPPAVGQFLYSHSQLP